MTEMKRNLSKIAIYRDDGEKSLEIRRVREYGNREYFEGIEK